LPAHFSIIHHLIMHTSTLRPSRPAAVLAAPSCASRAPRIAPRRAGSGPALPARRPGAVLLLPAPPTSSAAGAADAAPPAPRLGLVQHKAEARLFYRFLSIVYDKIVNPGMPERERDGKGIRRSAPRANLPPLSHHLTFLSPTGHWTVDMRTAALEPAKLQPTHKVVDVGGGTGFCTQGVVAAGVPAKNITLLDQSPHQLAKARAKPDLAGVTILEGDAEELPFPADTFDRYTSAGSIEYWPEPQRGIAEAYRVIKPGGLACVIGPVRPTHPLSRAAADAWMLFPEEREYLAWFAAAGFTDVALTRIGPPWYRGVRRHGLIMGCSVTGVKPKAGASPAVLGPKKEVSPATSKKAGGGLAGALGTAARVVLGSAAGFYYFVLPVYMWLKNLVWPKAWPM